MPLFVSLMWRVSLLTTKRSDKYIPLILPFVMLNILAIASGDMKFVSRAVPAVRGVATVSIEAQLER